MGATTGGPVTVWVLPGEAAGTFTAFPWRQLGGFVREDRLVPIKSVRTFGNKGDATFQLLRKQRLDGGFIVSDDFEPLPGQWVAICLGENLTRANLDWWGYISEVPERGLYESKVEPADLTGDYTAVVSAKEVGHLLDQIQIEGWRQVTGTGVTEEIENAPPWNRIDAGGKLVGNTTTFADGGETFYVFERFPSASSTVVGRHELIRHILKWCLPDALPAIAHTPITDSILDTIDVRNCTLKGAFDIGYPADLGYRWWIDVDDDGKDWVLNVELWDGTGTAINIVPSSKVIELEVSRNESSQYEEIVVEGERIVFASTLVYTGGSGNGARAWDNTDQSDFLEPLTSPTFSVEDQNTIKQFRGKSPAFQRYGLSGEILTGNLKITHSPGETGIDGSLSWFPEVDLSVDPGVSLSLDNVTFRDPTWQSGRFLKVIPWEREASAGSGKTTSRQPEYLPMLAFTKEGSLYRDLTSKRKGWTPITLKADTRGPYVWAKASPPELAAREDWTEDSQWSGTYPPAARYGFDYRDLLITGAIMSDQRLKITRRKTGFNASQVRKRYTLKRHDLQLWIVHEGTIVGVNKNGSAKRAYGTLVTRSDWATADAIADMLEANLLIERLTATIYTAGFDALATLGQTVSAINDGDILNEGTQYDMRGAIVEAVTRDYLARRSTFTINAVDVDVGKAFRAGSGNSPLRGGKVSTLALRGTAAQATERTEQRLAALEAAVQDIQQPIDLPESGEDAPARDEEAATVTAGKVYYRNGASWDLASLTNCRPWKDEIGLAENRATSGGESILVLRGPVKFDQPDPALDEGAEVYLTTTAGEISTVAVGAPIGRVMRTDDQGETWIDIYPTGRRNEPAEVELATVSGGAAGEVVYESAADTWSKADKDSATTHRQGVIDAVGAGGACRIVIRGPMALGNLSPSTDGEFYKGETAGQLETTAPSDGDQRPVARAMKDGRLWVYGQDTPEATSAEGTDFSSSGDDDHLTAPGSWVGNDTHTYTVTATAPRGKTYLIDLGVAIFTSGTSGATSAQDHGSIGAAIGVTFDASTGAATISGAGWGVEAITAGQTTNVGTEARNTQIVSVVIPLRCFRSGTTLQIHDGATCYRITVATAGTGSFVVTLTAVKTQWGAYASEHRTRVAVRGPDVVSVVGT